MDPVLQNLAWVGLGLAMFGLPGYAARAGLARLAGGGRFLLTQDGAAGVALESAGLSLALWPSLAFYLSRLGIPFNGTTIWTILGLSALIAAGDWARKRRKAQAHSSSLIPYSFFRLADWLPLAALTALAVFARFYAVRDLHIPLFGDSLHHTVIVQLIIDQQGIPTNYRPFAPVDSFTYHFGFHTLAAIWAQLTGQPAWGAVIAVGQILNALAVPAAYYLGRELFRSRLAGLFAAVATGFISGMPTYYVNWGRYTQLAGQVLIPFALVWFMRAVERPARRWRLSRQAVPGDTPRPGRGYQASPVLATGGGEPWKLTQWRGWVARLVLAALGAAGLFFTHYRIMIFYALFVLAYLVVETLRGSIAYRDRLEAASRMPRTYLRNLAGSWLAFLRGLYSRTLILALLGGLLVLPWLLNLVADYLSGLLNRLSTVTVDYLQIYNNPEYLGRHIGYTLPTLAGLGFVLLVAGAIQAIRSGHTAATATGGLWHGARAGLLAGLWTMLMIVSAVPSVLGLGGSGAIGTLTVGIALYMPFSLLAGAGLAWLVEAGALWLRAHGPRLRATLTGRAATVLPVALALAWLLATPGALNLDYSANTAYVADADLRAMEWIKANTPADALFLIGSQTSYSGRAVTATDAGMWIPLLTGRRVTLPPLVTGSEGGQDPQLWPHAREVATASRATTDPASLALFRADGVRYAYVGALRPTLPTQTLDLPAMLADPAHFPVLYQRDNVYIFGIQ